MQKPIILAVDDQPAILHSVAMALTESYQVRPFTSGRTALKYLEKQSADLILLDIDMPEMNGFDLAEIIRSRTEHKETPIVFLTGNTIEENISKTIESVGDGFVSKPVNRDVLLSKLKMHLTC